ncbi:MAG: endolytic transglycosylase MltG, partial [Firmicutes bacterium]|nr:endolytic transglycosylase MltG [Bacillota bacterium]
SAVFHNRLRIGMPLAADPTILFALGGHKEAVLYADLEVASPYNTYKNAGLPPGPIAVPGKASLEAALYPAEDDSLFFVAGPDGRHLFAKSFREHEANRRAVEKLKAKK